MSILYNVFLYFARFLTVEALEAAFRLPSGERHQQLQDIINTLSEDKQIPAIEDFIFSINREGVQKRFENIKGVYMLLEYSTISSKIDSVDVKTDSFRVAVTIARPRALDQDNATEMLWQDEMLDIISTIRRHMRDDLDAENSVWWLRFPATLMPFAAPSLGNSLGWTMEFDIQGTDIV